jgi:heme oxygenase
MIGDDAAQNGSRRRIHMGHCLVRVLGNLSNGNMVLNL